MVSTLKAKHEKVALCPFGVYNKVGQTISLSESFRNYTFLLIRSGYNTSDTTGGGAYFTEIPVDEIVLNNTQLGVSGQLNGCFFAFTLMANDEKTLKIINKYGIGINTSEGAIRQVFGIR